MSHELRQDDDQRALRALRLLLLRGKIAQQDNFENNLVG